MSDDSNTCKVHRPDREEIPRLAARVIVIPGQGTQTTKAHYWNNGEYFTPVESVIISLEQGGLDESKLAESQIKVEGNIR